MPKNALATAGKKKQFVEVTTILKSPALKAKLQNYIDEAVRAKTKILDENENIKQLRDTAVDDLNIEPKMFNVLVGLYFNNNFDQKMAELDKLQSALLALTGDFGGTTSTGDDE